MQSEEARCFQSALLTEALAGTPPIHTGWGFDLASTCLSQSNSECRFVGVAINLTNTVPPGFVEQRRPQTLERQR
jgi:hypothetical protein